MTILLIIAGYILVGLIIGRFVGRSVLKHGGFKQYGAYYTHQNVKPGDSEGALRYALWSGIFWPITIYLLLFMLTVVGILMGTAWLFHHSKGALMRVFVGKS